MFGYEISRLNYIGSHTFRHPSNTAEVETKLQSVIVMVTSNFLDLGVSTTAISSFKIDCLQQYCENPSRRFAMGLTPNS